MSKRGSSKLGGWILTGPPRRRTLDCIGCRRPIVYGERCEGCKRELRLRQRRKRR
jgi:hypothetical protein